MSSGKLEDGPADLVQIGASQTSRETLATLRDDGHIADLMDGYRLAVAVAIGFGRTPNLDSSRDRRTMFAVGNLDPDNSLREAIREIFPSCRLTPARALEDLAEQGIEILNDQYLTGTEFAFTEVIRGVQSANRLGDEGEL